MLTESQGRGITATMDTATVAISALGAGSNAAILASGTKYIKYYYRGSHLTALAGSGYSVNLTIEVDPAQGFSSEQVVVSDISVNAVSFGVNSPITLRNGAAYRYSFNGMERDDEVKGSGNSYTTFFRQYDPRLGRWLSTDPKTATSPWHTPYQAFSNNPTLFVDPFGDKEYKSYKAYKKDLGDNAIAKADWTGQDGHWLTSDRTDGIARWDGANEFNISTENTGQYESFTQIGDLYGWMKDKASSQGHDIQWLSGAHSLVSDLTMLDGVLNFTIDSDVEGLLRNLNVGIADFAMPYFNELLYKRGASDPIVGNEAFYWDKLLTANEQFIVAKPIYQKASSDAIEKMQAMASQEFHSANPMATIGSMLFSGVPPFTGSVTDAQYRYEFAMKLLYPTKFRGNHPEIKKLKSNYFNLD